MRISKKKHFLVTGGAGFIGSHLCEELLRLGHSVAAIDDLSTGRMSNLTSCMEYSNFHFARSNIMDQTVLDRLASSADVIIHLAAAVGVQLIIEKPVHTIETNIRGTEAVLQSALRYNCKVLIASTSEVYGKGIKVPFKEEDDVVLGTTDKSRWAYAASKMVDEFLAHAYFREYGLGTTFFRLFNTVGPRQSGQYGMVIPRMIRRALKNQPIDVYGDGTQCRCFCHVSDVINALIGLTESTDTHGRLFNIGATEEISILGLAERIKTLTGSSSEIRLIPYSEAYGPGFEDMARRIPDTSRIHSLLGWSPKHSLDEILKSVIEYERGQIKLDSISELVEVVSESKGAVDKVGSVMSTKNTTQTTQSHTKQA